jgi:hypothetical protein
MRFKLDENLGTSALAVFRAAGHDVSSVHLQALDGAPDEQVFTVCHNEGRVLVTCGAGVAVLRLPRSPGPSDIRTLVEVLLEALAHHDITGSLWVVRPDRVRVWEPPADGASA